MRKIRSDKVLSTREEAVVNALRNEYGFTINEVQALFGVSKDVVRNADPMRKLYQATYKR